MSLDVSVSRKTREKTHTFDFNYNRSIAFCILVRKDMDVNQDERFFWSDHTTLTKSPLIITSNGEEEKTYIHNVSAHDMFLE
jgi:hypothetical protein